jgi:hypothetical protein
MASMVPVPSRMFKTISMWILMFAGVGDLAIGLIQSLEVAHIVTGAQLAGINAVIVFLAGASKLVQQNIALTPDQKDTLHEAIDNAPVKVDPKVTPPTQPMTPP